MEGFATGARAVVDEGLDTFKNHLHARPTPEPLQVKPRNAQVRAVVP